MPQKINSTGTNTNGSIMQSVNFSYAANGTKLRKQAKIDHQVSATWDYSGRFIYADNNGDNTQLAYLTANHGSLVMHENGSSTYEYSLKDHLGNTRITFDEDMNILQEDAYYPFGMNISGLSYSNTSPENKYKYNGKRCTERSRSELQGDFGLDWYDYGARMYDAELGRWHVPDPLAEKTFSLSPFRYGKNNPVFYVDVKGLSEFEQSYSSFSIGRYGSITAHASGSSGSDEAEKTDSKEKDKLPAWLISFNAKNKLKIKMFGSSLKRNNPYNLPSLSEGLGKTEANTGLSDIGESSFGGNNKQPSSILTPTITKLLSQRIFPGKFVSAEIYTQGVTEGNAPFGFSFDTEGKFSGISVTHLFGTMSIGIKDKSCTYSIGGHLSIGFDENDYLIDLSIPYGKNTVSGATLKFDRQNTDKLIRYSLILSKVAVPALRAIPVP